MNCKFINQEGKESLYYMGCYGIGVSRTVAAVYEANIINDAKWGPCGFVLPTSIAPYKVQIVPKMENEEKYMQEGFADYIAKPFSRDQIKEKLDKIFKD